MKDHQHAEGATVYACPMHPEITGRQGDKCSKCGMDLVAVDQYREQRYEVQLTTSPQTIEAGTPATLTFRFTESGQNVPLDIAHEMKVHLMVISDDLSWFRHIHPEEQADGSYVVTETFPGGGKYLFFTDFKPRGGSPTVDKQEIEVEGRATPGRVGSSGKFVSEVDGYKVTLENGRDFKTNRTQPLQISIEQNGRKLSGKDLQQYLGAAAHIVMIGKADKDYLHIHPLSDTRFPVYAETHIETAGIYRIWVQFQTNGVVHTADFTVEAGAGNASEAQHGAHSHPH